MAEANAVTDRQREYREVYLRSEHWRETRAAALERAEHRCQVCNSAKQLDVHHRTYERIGQERPADLTVLCRTCHDRHHRNYNVVTLAPGKKPKGKRNKPNQKQRRKAAKAAKRTLGYSEPKPQKQFRKLTSENEKLHQRQVQAAANRAQRRAEKRDRVSVDTDWMHGAA